MEFWGVFVVIIAAGIFFCTVKSGFKEDEIYSYGLSNSQYMPFLNELFENTEGEGTVISRQELWNYITVNDGDSFDYGSVYYNQTQDVHPPLYYFLLHTICSFFPETFSKWLGLSLNLILFAGTLLLLYKIMDRLLEGANSTERTDKLSAHRAGLVAMILYGLSMAGMSEVVLIRMYMLASFLNVLLVWWVLRLLRKRSLSLYFALGITIFAGLTTHYYFVFYAFFVCAMLDIYFLVTKRRGAFAAVSVAAILAVLCMYLYYPAGLEDLLSGEKVSEEGFLENISSIWNIGSSLFITCRILMKGMAVAFLMGIAGCCQLIVRRSRLKGQPVGNNVVKMLILSLPAVLDFVVVSLLTPSLRYIYNAIPLVAVTVAYIWYWVMMSWNGERGKTESSIVISILLSIIMLFFFEPEHLYRDHRQYNEVLKEMEGSPVIYYTGDYHSSITENVEQMLMFPDVYIQEEPVTEGLGDYMNGHTVSQSIVVFFAKYPEMFDNDIYLSQLNDALGGHYEPELLYDGTQSRTYLMRIR